MRKFFGFPDYGDAQGAYSWQHLLFISLILVTMVVLAVLLGKKYRNKDNSNIVLIWSAILIDGFELIKIVLNLYKDIDSWKMNLPLFLCSIQLITIPLAAFSKGRLKEASLDFVLIFGILGAVLGTVGAAQNYNAYPVLSFPNVVSAITHSISGFASLYIIFSRMCSMKKKNIPLVLGILFMFCALALGANLLLDYNYMFLMSHDGTPYVIFYNLVNGNKILYPMIVILLFVAYVLGFIYIFNFIKNKSERN